MKEITHPVAIRIINDLLERMPIKRTGTFNTADPTAFEGFLLKHRGLHITATAAWGTEITIYSGEDEHNGIELAGIYLDTKWDYNTQKEIPCLYTRDGWTFQWFKIIRDINKRRKPQTEQNNAWREQEAEISKYR